jgi:hypothetical protein
LKRLPIATRTKNSLKITLVLLLSYKSVITMATTPYYNAGAPVVVQGQEEATPYYNAGAQTPIVVQGREVHNPTQLLGELAYHNMQSTNNDDATTGNEWKKGEQQPKQYRDVFWALLFYVHLGVVAFAAAIYAPAMAQGMAEDYGGGGQNRRSMTSSFANSSSSTIRRWLGDGEQQESNWGGDNYGENLNVDMESLFMILFFTGFAGFFLSSLAMAFMMNFAEGLIKMALWFNIIVSGLITTVALAAGVYQLAIMCGIGFLISAYYAYVVWSRIPFAASNLISAVTAVRANIGLAAFAYLNLFVSFGWSVWWAIAAVATTYVLNGCDADGNCDQEASGVIVFLFLLSYYWTAQVIKNVVHVTVAGTVGKIG